MDANTTESLAPRDGELQPEFAIRFHTSMMDAIPNTEARTQRCFEIWRDVVGDEPEVATARRYHKAADYIERRDIPVFEEHEIPSRKSKDGKRTIPAVKYDRRALAAICRNMNEAVEDIGKFCPITNGHTSDDRADAEPEVLGYTGAYRLGMVGNTKPRYAIFADEYHRKDRDEVLKGRRGRSVEVLPLPDVNKRSFYPIAALGADEPRLNLPPARYFNRPGANGEDIEVERYQMVAPGGSSTFVPGDDKDKYGDEQELPQSTIKNIMEAWTASAMGQWIINKMEQEGAAGSPNPLVHQAPQMAEMPDDPAAGGMPGQPGQPQPGLNDQADPTSQGQQGSDFDFNDDDDGIPPKSEPAQQDAGGDTQKPPFQGKGKMTEQKPEQYSTKSSGLQAIERLEARVTAMEAENAGLRAKLVGAERYSKLSSLKSQGIEFDLDKELGRVATQDDAQFAGHVETIEKYYRRSPAAVADFSEIHGAGKQGNLPDAAGNGVDELSQGDAEGVMKYALKHGCDYVQARERYKVEKTAGKNTAG